MPLSANVIVMIFGPTSAYYFQYKLIKKTKSLGTFSIDVCAILIFANLLRVFFRFGKVFKSALLYQAITMIIVQIFLLKECIQVRGKHLGPASTFDLKEDVSVQVKKFWRWDDFESYAIIVKAVLFIAGVFSVLTFLFSSNEFYVELVGGASATVEACLGLPQLLANSKNKSTEGLSMGLIMIWFGGDLFKTLYFILNGEPIQFIMCGSSQLLIDVLILGQIYTYAQNKGYRELEKTTSKEADMENSQKLPSDSEDYRKFKSPVKNL